MLVGFVKYLLFARMIAPFRDSRYHAASVRLRVAFCGLTSYRPIPRSAKVRPAYRKGIEYAAQNRQKRKKPCAAFNTQHRLILCCR